MPNCGKTRGRDRRLFLFPEEETYPQFRAEIKKRREAWLKAVGIEEIINQLKPQHLFICGDHFCASKDYSLVLHTFLLQFQVHFFIVIEKPAPLLIETDIDWIPTLLLRPDEDAPMDVEMDPLNFVEVQLNDAPSVPPRSEAAPAVPDHYLVVGGSLNGSSISPTEIQRLTSRLDETTAQLIQKSACLEASQLEVAKLKVQLARAEWKLEEQQKISQSERVISHIRGNDKVTRFYTGFKSWEIFTSVFNSINKSQNPLSALSGQQEFLLTLMKLRLNLRLFDLGSRFDISSTNASRCVKRWIDLIFYNLPASNISGPGLEKPCADGKMNVEEKLRKGLKITYSILDENLLTDDRLLDEDKVGFTFLYKATYVCDYLMQMNKDSSNKSPTTSTVNQ